MSTTDLTRWNSDLTHLLSQPNGMLSLLFEGDTAEFFLMSYDLDFRIKYLSESAWSICGIDFKRWENENLRTMFTEHERNLTLANDVDFSASHAVQKTYCEIWNDERDKVKLEMHRRLAVVDEHPVGYIAMAKTIHEFPLHSTPMGMDCLEFFSRLSIGEVEVIKLVIDGLLNKTIAKQLGIALRTVEARRSKAMSKLGVSTVPDLVKLWCSFQNRY